MPELPEVEVIRRGLVSGVEGAVIARLTLTFPKLVRGDAEEFVTTLPGRTILRLRRYGKALCFGLAPHRDSGFGVRDSERAGFSGMSVGDLADPEPNPESRGFLIHLGMTGHLGWAAAEEPLERHTHAIWELQGSPRQLRYTDPRRFGFFQLWGEGRPSFLDGLGPDPLEISEKEWRERLRGRSRQIKALLLDQGFIAGLGNIYCDEMLFEAGVHPGALASRLSGKRAGKLREAMRRILQEAIGRGGSTIDNYRNAAGEAGSFQDLHRVYGRDGQPCPRCGTTLRREVYGGRSSHFCPRCQK